MNANCKKFRKNSWFKSVPIILLVRISEFGYMAHETKRRMMELVSSTPTSPRDNFDKLLLKISE